MISQRSANGMTSYSFSRARGSSSHRRHERKHSPVHALFAGILSMPASRTTLSQSTSQSTTSPIALKMRRFCPPLSASLYRIVSHFSPFCTRFVPQRSLLVHTYPGQSTTSFPSYLLRKKCRSSPIPLPVPSTSGTIHIPNLSKSIVTSKFSIGSQPKG